MKIEITKGENNPVAEFFSSSSTPETDAEGGRCPVCTPEQKCWECADDTSMKGGAK